MASFGSCLSRLLEASFCAPKELGSAGPCEAYKGRATWLPEVNGPRSGLGRYLGTEVMSDTSAVAEVEPKQKPEVDKEHRKRRQPPYNVVLLNDDDHTYEYVIEMLKALFGYPVEKGFQLAREVDTTGRVIVATTTKEHAELKRDQIHAFGPDHRLPRCKGAMSAVIEPAE